MDERRVPPPVFLQNLQNIGVSGGPPELSAGFRGGPTRDDGAGGGAEKQIPFGSDNKGNDNKVWVRWSWFLLRVPLPPGDWWLKVEWMQRVSEMGSAKILHPKGLRQIPQNKGVSRGVKALSLLILLF